VDLRIAETFRTNLNLQETQAPICALSVPQSQHVQPTTWLTAIEAATYLKVAHRTLLSWARQGKVKGHILSGIQRQTWRFRQADLDACFKEIPWQQ
jgi:excisionase family DNA binding protein